MLTRRNLLLASAARAATARDSGATTEADAELSALAGKKPLIQRTYRPPNFETPTADLVPLFTPNDVFFVRYHLADIPRVDPHSWRLQVGGASAQHTLSLSLQELKRGFEHVTIAAVNQCSGNRRGLCTPRVAGVQWGNGAMGHERWSGVRLRDVLRRAGVACEALEVVFNGADGPVLPQTPDFVKSLPVDRAL